MRIPDFQFLRTEPVDLQRYLPVFLFLSPEFKSLETALAKEHERQRLAQNDVAKQLHAETATWGMASWERMLGIKVDESVSMETRRASVLAKMQKPPTVTPEFLTNMINLFTTIPATKIVEHPNEYTVDIYLPDSGTRDFSKIDEAVQTYLPAHLGHTYHFKMSANAGQYYGSVIRMDPSGFQVGRIKGDSVQMTYVFWSVDTPVFAVNDDGSVHPTPLGLKLNPVFRADKENISISPDAPVGAADGIFYIAEDGTVRLTEEG